MEITSRNVKAYLKHQSRVQALRLALLDAEQEKKLASAKLTGGMLAEATRYIKVGNPYSSVVRVTTHAPNGGN
jgi:hypothetical protein